jgi:uncharacterized pyridoxal phosphate-containing UPF0001 family protein
MPEPTPSAERLSGNLERVRAAIAHACRRTGRDPAVVRLVAVTKSVDLDTIRALMALGVHDLGENRVQQLVRRAADLGADLSSAWSGRPGPGPVWHMIGHLQRNKVRTLLQHSRTLHSLDSPRLADEIEREAARPSATAPHEPLPPGPAPTSDRSSRTGPRDETPSGGIVDVLIEVNVAGEASKTGVAPDEAARLAEHVASLPHLRLCGLMTMAPFEVDPQRCRRYFARLRELLGELRGAGVVGPQCGHLSMGMSNDYAVAVEEGATIVRIGTALFE